MRNTMIRLCLMLALVGSIFNKSAFSQIQANENRTLKVCVLVDGSRQMITFKCYDVVNDALQAKLANMNANGAPVKVTIIAVGVGDNKLETLSLWPTPPGVGLSSAKPNRIKNVREQSVIDYYLSIQLFNSFLKQQFAENDGVIVISDNQQVNMLSGIGGKFFRAIHVKTQRKQGFPTPEADPIKVGADIKAAFDDFFTYNKTPTVTIQRIGDSALYQGDSANYQISGKDFTTLKVRCLTGKNTEELEVNNGLVKYTFMDAGRYTIEATAFSISMNSTVKQVSEVVKPLPTIVSSFVTPNNVITNEAVEVTVETKDAEYVLLEFGDGKPVNYISKTKHVFEKPGQYQIEAIAKSGTHETRQFIKPTVIVTLGEIRDKSSMKLAEKAFQNVTLCYEQAQKIDAKKYFQKEWNNAERHMEEAKNKIEGKEYEQAIISFDSAAKEFKDLENQTKQVKDKITKLLTDARQAKSEANVSLVHEKADEVLNLDSEDQEAKALKKWIPEETNTPLVEIEKAPSTTKVGRNIRVVLTLKNVKDVSVDFGDGHKEGYNTTNKSISHVYRNEGAFTIVASATDLKNQPVLSEKKQVTVSSDGVGVFNIIVFFVVIAGIFWGYVKYSSKAIMTLIYVPNEGGERREVTISAKEVRRLNDSTKIQFPHDLQMRYKSGKTDGTGVDGFQMKSQADLWYLASGSALDRQKITSEWSYTFPFETRHEIFTGENSVAPVGEIEVIEIN